MSICGLFGGAWWWLVNYGLYLGLPLLAILVLAGVLGRRQWRRLDAVYKKSWANQEEMISLLKEIRDSLKK